LYRRPDLTAIFAVLFLLSACAPVVSVSPPPPAEKAPAETAEAPSGDTPKEAVPEADAQPETDTRETAPAKPNPRALAALELTEQGRAMIADNRPDDAIRVLEQAINLHPKNGQNYYYMAEAWLLKRNLPQAREFHRLAGIYLRDDTAWASRLKIQELKIKNF
jgi:tetratricopeptide (TPR) repeat protein